MDLDLQGKRVLVLGASQGLGFAVAESFAKEGAHLAICSRSSEKIQKAAKKLPNAKGFAIDLSQKDAGKKAVEKAVKLLGAIDILVTNTGNPAKGHFLDLTADDWQNAYQSLWMSAVQSIQEALPFMLEQKWGRIFLLTSFAAKEPYPKLTISNALRAGILGLMKSLSTEFAQENITINALLPGFTKTEALKSMNVPNEVFLRDIPMNRLGNPEELASLCAYLASPKAGYITGQAIAVDGGLLKSF